ncbi:metallophosphoesterase [Clostridium sp. AL.422]|uniref:metallophosphoesterase n=1 Tax=Clostridium TaxID=1485 RepID=UPI00293DE6B1|nr:MULTISPECIES: metallophosphoesterase [unclassified Clostridium]MDV4151530.1 metallophosphoesterase [Clostridium sp. AL.422]
MKSRKRGMKILVMLVLFVGAFYIFSIWQNNSIVISSFNYSSPKVPKGFDSFKIVQISDLHNKVFGKEQDKLLEKVESLSPDIIVITGDIVDRRKYNIENAMYFVDKAIKIAPIYYVSGNHEAWSGKYSEVKEKLIEAGAHIIDDEMIEVKRNNSIINILGLSDPAFITTSYLDETDTSKMEENLKNWSRVEGFKILLSHRPELFDLYSKNNINIVFSGHAHGGQIRIPFLGGIIAPNQGFFPKYSEGSYNSNQTTMFVSRGLGNSLFPIRIFNRPEIISVTLKVSK